MSATEFASEAERRARLEQIRTVLNTEIEEAKKALTAEADFLQGVLDAQGLRESTQQAASFWTEVELGVFSNLG